MMNGQKNIKPFLRVLKILVSKANLLLYRLVRETFYGFLSICMRQNATDVKQASIQSVY